MIEDLKTNGFCIIKNVFTSDEINEFKKKFSKCEANVHKICEEIPSDPYEYVQLFEKESIVEMRSYCNDSIIETAKGAIHKSCGQFFGHFDPLPFVDHVTT